MSDKMHSNYYKELENILTKIQQSLTDTVSIDCCKSCTALRNLNEIIERKLGKELVDNVSRNVPNLLKTESDSNDQFNLNEHDAEFNKNEKINNTNGLIENSLLNKNNSCKLNVKRNCNNESCDIVPNINNKIDGESQMEINKIETNCWRANHIENSIEANNFETNNSDTNNFETNNFEINHLKANNFKTDQLETNNRESNHPTIHPETDKNLQSNTNNFSSKTEIFNNSSNTNNQNDLDPTKNSNINSSDTQRLDDLNSQEHPKHDTTNTAESESNLIKQNDKLKLEVKDLTTKLSDLESCIELLRNEYEKCEDYWAAKLDEERQMFEQEQTQSTDKLNELIGKILEYEAQFAHQNDNRLPPIEEKYGLEQQFTDLEEEFEKYKYQVETQIEEKSREIFVLQEKLAELSCKMTNDVEIQVSLDLNDFSNFKKRWNKDETDGFVSSEDVRISNENVEGENKNNGSSGNIAISSQNGMSNDGILTEHTTIPKENIANSRESIPASNMPISFETKDVLPLENTSTLNQITPISSKNIQSQLNHLSKLSSHLIETTNWSSSDAIPFNWNENMQQQNCFKWNTNCSSEDITNADTNHSMSSSSSKETTDVSASSLPSNMAWDNAQINNSNSLPANLPVHNDDLQNATPCRPKRTRKHERKLMATQRYIEYKIDCFYLEFYLTLCLFI